VRGLTDTPSGGGAGAAQSVASGDRSAAGATDAAGSLTDTLRQAIERHAGNLVLLCSFQKEESVLVDEVVRLNQELGLLNGGGQSVRIMTIDTGVLFPETLETWKAFEERFGITVGVEDASAASLGLDKPWSGPENCCSQAKVKALERALDGAQAWITGLRREQGPTRASAELVERDEARGMWKYNPLAFWSERDIWRRIHERELPYHPLHDRGYASIGCATCTLPGSGREGRWAGSEKTECGLHVHAVDPMAKPEGATA